MKRNKKICNKCNCEISYSNYERHYNICNGKNVRLISINNTWLQENGKYKCPYCNKIFTKMGICSHIIITHLNNKHQKNNLIEYNKKVKLGILPKNKNQYQLAKEHGEQYNISEDTRKKMSKIKFGIKLSKETREKISKARSEFLEEIGSGGFINIKWYKIKNIKEEEFIVRGKWEYEIANILNNENIYWIRKIYLKYIKNEIIKTYSPDFYLPEYNIYIEVKGYYSQLDKEKINLVVNQNNINLQLVFEHDLKIIRNIGFKKYWDVSALSYTQ
jgi:hypothetical protein